MFWKLWKWSVLRIYMHRHDAPKTEGSFNRRSLVEINSLFSVIFPHQFKIFPKTLGCIFTSTDQIYTHLPSLQLKTIFAQVEEQKWVIAHVWEKSCSWRFVSVHTWNGLLERVRFSLVSQRVPCCWRGRNGTERCAFSWASELRGCGHCRSFPELRYVRWACKLLEGNQIKLSLECCLSPLFRSSV